MTNFVLAVGRNANSDSTADLRNRLHRAATEYLVARAVDLPTALQAADALVAEKLAKGDQVNVVYLTDGQLWAYLRDAKRQAA